MSWPRSSTSRSRSKSCARRSRRSSAADTRSSCCGSAMRSRPHRHRGVPSRRCWTMAPEALQIEMWSSHEAIDLIDAFRAEGLEAGLADAPGAWDVAVACSMDEIVPVLAAEEIPFALVHASGRLYLIEAEPQPGLVPARALEAV